MNCRAKLHEMCIGEMKEELKGKTQKHIELLDAFNAAKKELDRANLRYDVLLIHREIENTVKCEHLLKGLCVKPKCVVLV